MAGFKQIVRDIRRLRYAGFAKGHFDGPDAVAKAGRHLFYGWVACREPIDDMVLELDGFLYRPVKLHPRADVPRSPDLPHVTGWQIALDVPTARLSRKRPARLLVNGKTAVTASFTFASPGPPAYEATPDESSSRPEERFFAAAAALPTGSRVLEIGTRRAVDATSTHRWGNFPGLARADYIMCDVLPGIDVDVVADLHDLPVSWADSFDAFLAFAVFEHLERPWVAAKEVARILKPGGIALICTHQCFPLHGYPRDFFRFSKEALALIFEDAGLQVTDASYRWRATITAPYEMVPPAFHDQWNATWPSYLGVLIFVTKAV